MNCRRPFTDTESGCGERFGRRSDWKIRFEVTDPSLWVMLSRLLLLVLVVYLNGSGMSTALLASSSLLLDFYIGMFGDDFLAIVRPHEDFQDTEKGTSLGQFVLVILRTLGVLWCQTGSNLRLLVIAIAAAAFLRSP